MTAPKPTSTGTLGVAPLLNLLLLTLDKKLSGTLLLETTAGGATMLSFASGTLVKIRPAAPVARLGELLTELSGVHETTIELASATRSGPKLLGQRLLQAGVIEPPALDAALREQLVRRILWAGRLPVETAYSFYDGVDLLRDWAEPVTVDPLALIWSYVKVNASDQELEVLLARLGSRDLKLRPGAKVQRFQFSSKILGALDVMRAKPQSLVELMATNLVDADTLKRVIYALGVTRHLDVGREDLEPMAVATGQTRHPPAPTGPRVVRRRFEPRPAPARASAGSDPQGGAASPESLLSELQQLLENLDSLNYYQLLGVAESAPAVAIQSAFLNLAKKWHPDKLPAELSEARSDAGRVFARISEAHQMLSHEEQRQEYDKLRQGNVQKKKEQETVEQVLRAAALYQKAQILAKKQDFAGAEELALKAFESDPEQGEYGAFYAWVVVQDPQHKEKDFDSLMDILDRALRRDKKNVQIHFYRAVVLRRAGRVDEAMKGFRFVVDQDPKNVEAAREIRLHKMRAEETRKDSSPKLFGKLFKR